MFKCQIDVLISIEKFLTLSGVERLVWMRIAHFWVKLIKNKRQECSNSLLLAMPVQSGC
jgi:hypothetical protein